MGDLGTIWNGLDWSVLTDILFSIIPALVCIIVHEICHGLAAYFLGDETARAQGRLSFNPLRHIDPVGLLMMVVFRFGWAKPVSVDMRNFKNPKRDMALTALAGPVSNFLLAALLAVFYGLFFSQLTRLGAGEQTALDMLWRTISMSIGLGIFNLLPIPPLDGSKVLFSILPNEWYYKLMRYERYGMILLIGVVMTGVLDKPLGTAIGSVLGAIFRFISIPMAELAMRIF